MTRDLDYRFNASDLRQRCQAMVDQLNRNAMLRQGSPADDLMAFVIAETGRTADKSLEHAKPLCLYFADDTERDEFIAIYREAKPNSVSRKLP